MADVKLNTLPQSTSPTSTQDLLLFDESTNAGQRINYNTLADVILAKLTSKTYTVGGGTQTLISAIDALNSNTYMLEPSQSNMLTNGTDILNLNNGVYFAGSNEVAVSLVNKPTGLDTNCKIIVEERIRGRKMVTVIAPYKVWVNQRVGGSEWGGWKLTPTRAEMDALNSNLYSLQGGNNFVDIPQNSDLNSANYVLPGNYVCGMNSTAASLSNSPVSVAFVMRVESSAGSKVQTGSTWANIIRTIIPHNDPQTIYRQFVSTGNTAGVWTYREWVKMPTRSEVDTLNSKLFEKRSSQRGSVLKIVFNNYSTGALIFGATSNTNPFVYVYSNGYLAPVVMDNNINVELSSDYKTVTITNNTDTALYIDVINPKGDASIINA